LEARRRRTQAGRGQAKALVVVFLRVFVTNMSDNCCSSKT
jgi:hypothetical protein